MRRRTSTIEAELGARLRTYRKSACLSQRKLGGAIGVTFQQIQKYENGSTRMAASTLIDLAHVLDVDIRQFVEGLKQTTRRLKAVAGEDGEGRRLTAMAPFKSEPPGMERDSKGHAVPIKQRVPEDRAKAKRAKKAKPRK